MQFVKRSTAIAVLLLMIVSVMGPIASGNEGTEPMAAHASSDGTPLASRPECQDRTMCSARATP